MIKAKSKQRAMPKKRKLYEITGEESELNIGHKRRRLDESAEEIKQGQEDIEGRANNLLGIGMKIDFSPKATSSMTTNMFALESKRMDASSTTP
jgi:hypothetical protein